MLRSSERERIVRVWQSYLRARSEFESSRASALRYTDRRVNGKRLTLTIADPIPLDLLGQDRLIRVSSKGFAPHLVTEEFLGALRRFTSSGGEVEISIHQSSISWRNRGKDWERAYATIDEMSQGKNSRVRVSLTKEERYYHLSWDGTIAMVCNRPLLSNQGRVKSFEQFAGFVLQEPGLVEAYLRRVVG